VALSHRVEAYNEQLEMIERMERWGEVAVIRPERKIEVGRVEKDIDKLERLYEEGFMLGERFCKEWS
jgi:predicted patatin/cPLA2 family phospholipase